MNLPTTTNTNHERRRMCTQGDSLAFNYNHHNHHTRHTIGKRPTNNGEPNKLLSPHTPFSPSSSSPSSLPLSFSLFLKPVLL